MTETGPNSVGSCSNVDRDGKGSWDNPTNAETQDGNFAYEDIAKDTYTDWLRCVNFGFAIDEVEQIDGIEVEIDWYAESTDVDEDSIRLVLDGVVKGDEKSTGANVGTINDDNYNSSFGGVADDWNASLTAANINDATFGVQISVKNDQRGQSRQCRIDHVQITIAHHSTGGVIQYSEKKINKLINGKINEGIN